MLEMNRLEVINTPMKNHKQAGIIKRRTKMRERIECVLPCGIAGYERDVDCKTRELS